MVFRERSLLPTLLVVVVVFWAVLDTEPRAATCWTGRQEPRPSLCSHVSTAAASWSFFSLKLRFHTPWLLRIWPGHNQLKQS